MVGLCTPPRFALNMLVSSPLRRGAWAYAASGRRFTCGHSATLLRASLYPVARAFRGACRAGRCAAVILTGSAVPAGDDNAAHMAAFGLRFTAASAGMAAVAARVCARSLRQTPLRRRLFYRASVDTDNTCMAGYVSSFCPLPSRAEHIRLRGL